MKAVLPHYSGDLFSTGGEYLDGLMYLSRVPTADEGDGKFVKMKKLLSGKEKKIIMSDSGLESNIEAIEPELQEGSDISSKLYCATSLCNWSRNAANANRLAEEDAVKAIMKLSMEKMPRILVFCAGAFRYMSEQPVLANKMIEENALSSILEMIGTKTDDFICGNLAIALLNLTRINGREGKLVEDSIVLCLMNLIGQRQELHATCCRGLYNLTCVDTNYPLIERVIRALISLSSSGIASVKHICAAALCNLADLKGVRLRMIEEGVVSVLSNLARGSETRTRRVCAVILQNLTSSKPCRNEMVARNCVQVCYGLSSDQDPIILRCIGLTLSRLALESANCPRIINDGGIMALCNIAVKYPTIPGISQPAAVAFQLMSSRPNIRVAIVHEGSVAAVASLLRLSHDVFTLQHGLLALCNLLSSPENHLSIVQQGLMSTLIALSSHANSLLKDFCALAFFNLSCSEESRKHIVNAGAITAIINSCESDSELTKRRCAASLCNITTFESGIRRMVSDGIVPALCKLFLVKDVETIRYACAALCRLCSTVETGKLILESGAIPHVVTGAISGDPVNKEFCCAVISSLSYYESCRIPLCEFGAIAALKSLSSLNDDDTKKRLLVAFANLSCTPSLQEVMVNDGVVEIIAKLADSYQEMNQMCCARALCNLACAKQSKLRIVQEDGVAALMMVCMVRSVSHTTKTLCVRALLNLLEDSTLDYLLKEGVIDAISSLGKLGEPGKLADPQMIMLCARLFNQLSTYEQARLAFASRASYLKAVFEMFGSPDEETKVVIARSSCNLLYAKKTDVLLKAVSAGILDVIGQGALLADSDASQQCLEGIFLLSQKSHFCPTIVASQIPYLLCSLCSGQKDMIKVEICLQIFCNLTSSFDVRKPLQVPAFMDSFIRAVSNRELNERCFVWTAQILRYLVFGYGNYLDIVDRGILRQINRLSNCSHPIIMESIAIILRELCSDSRCISIIGSGGIVGILHRIVAGNSSKEVFYDATVLLYLFAMSQDVRYKVVSSNPDQYVALLVLISQCKNIECVEILASILFLVTNDQKCRPFLGSETIAHMIVHIIEEGPTSEAMSNVVLSVFNLTKLPPCRALLTSASVDRMLLKLSQGNSPKIKANCTNALKNLSSDAAEAIDEGTVAALIAISLEGKGYTNKNDDTYDPPTIIKMDIKQNGLPKSSDGISLAKQAVSPNPWYMHAAAVTGDFAVRPPPPPQPPAMASESSGDHPSMVDDLDAGESEGRTKMSFAKMQTPQELRESYVFDDHDFDVHEENDIIEVASSGDDAGSLEHSPVRGQPDVEEVVLTKESGNESTSNNDIAENRASGNNSHSVTSPKHRRAPQLAPVSPTSASSSHIKKKTEFTVEEKAVQLGLYS